MAPSRMRIQPHVAVFPFPFSSHLSALLCLSRRLAELAPDVAFSFFITSRSNASLSPALPPNLKIYHVKDGLPEGQVFQGSKRDEIELFLSATPGNLLEGLQVQGLEREVTCVLSDTFLVNAGNMAEEMGVPWICFWIGNTYSLETHVCADLIRTTIGTQPHEVAARLDDPLDFIPGFSEFCVRDLPEGIVFGPLHSPFFIHLHRMGQELPRATAVLISSIEEVDSSPALEHLRTILKSCLPVGTTSLITPVSGSSSGSISDPHSCLTWLDAHGPASVVYVAFGTTATPPLSEQAVLAEGLEASGSPFLLSLGDEMRDKLPAGFLERTRERGLVVPWTPQRAVLGHVAVGAFVNHCGWGSVLESVVAGLPMLYRPIFADQMINARLASNVLGVGVLVKGGALTRDGVMEGLDLLLRQDEGKKIKERVSSVKLLVKNALSETGSSTRNLNKVLEIIKGC